MDKIKHLQEKPQNQESLIKDFLFNILSNRIEIISKKELDFFDDLDNFIKNQINKWKTKEDLVRIFQRLFTSYSVSWIINKNWKLLKKTDIDNKASLFLLRKYWFKTNNVWYNSNKKYIKHKYINLWQWEEWFKISGYETSWLKSFFQDATISVNNKIISNSYITYILLDKLWLIPENEKENIKNFVSFIHLSSKGKFDFLKWNGINFYKDYYKTIYWIAPFLPIDFIFDYISQWNTWFEILNDDFLMNNKVNINKWITYFKYYSDLRKNQINDWLEKIEEQIENKQVVKYHNQKLEFVVDTEWKIPNALDAISALWKWLIKIYKSWDIIIFNPLWFPPKMNFLQASKREKIVIIKRKSKTYFEKIEKLLNLVTWKFWKYSILRTIWYKWDLYNKLHLPQTELEKQYKAMQKRKEKDRLRRIKNKIKWYEKQNFLLEDLKRGKRVYGRIFDINKDNRIFVDIWLKCPDCEVYVTPTRLKWKEYNIKRILKNKFAKRPEEREEIILVFKIIDIETNTAIPRVRLVQI